MRYFMTVVLLPILLLAGCAIDREERQLALKVNVATMTEYFCVATQLGIIVDALLKDDPSHQQLIYIKGKLQESKINVAQMAALLREMVESSSVEDIIKQGMFDTLDTIILFGMNNVKFFSAQKGE